MNPQLIRVLLGVNDLNNPDEPGRSMHTVQSISLHDDWDALTASYDADIAVLNLKREAIFNKYVQPINFIPSDSSVAAITSGFVIGYGQSANDSKNVPKILETPIIKNAECFSNNSLLPVISSGRTFCGMISNSTEVCRCNSGNILFVTDGTSSYLSGLVSSLNAADTYSVFTNVSKYIDWIYETY